MQKSLTNKTLLDAKKIFFWLIFVSLIGCKHQSGNSVNKSAPQNSIIVFIQPFGNFDNGVAKSLQSKIQSVLSVHVNLSSPIALPRNAWYAPRHRYWADSILLMLKPMHPQKNSYTLGITDEDISTKKLEAQLGRYGAGFSARQLLCSIHLSFV
jgi:archaemetzincin